MTATAAPVSSRIVIERPSSIAPILFSIGPTYLAVSAGVAITLDGRRHAFDVDTPVDLAGIAPGTDYAVAINAMGDLYAAPADDVNPLTAGHFAGFHFAPAGNARGRVGGVAAPAINPYSIWDAAFRPAAPDPRGMTLAETPDGHRFWADIYLLGKDHEKHGTSRHGATIADGASLGRLNYRDAVEIYARHGKRLLTYDEFRAAAYGVTEKSAADRDPKTTGLDAARTSRFGLMQATGNLWIWGTDGDEDPRPSFFGGSWRHGSNAGSRFADLALWDGSSDDDLSARGACDHLELV